MEITLIRHGKPTFSSSSVVTSSEYVKWMRRYNFSDVSEHSRPQQIKKELGSHYIVSSDFNRAIHSTEIYTGRSPDLIAPLYREMEIPRYKLPFRLKPMTWIYGCRALWMLGVSGPFETYHQAIRRSEQAVHALIGLANEHGSVVLFGHGYMNWHLRRGLIGQGWRLNCKSNSYWGLSSLAI